MRNVIWLLWAFAQPDAAATQCIPPDVVRFAVVARGIVEPPFAAEGYLTTSGGDIFVYTVEGQRMIYAQPTE